MVLVGLKGSSSSSAVVSNEKTFQYKLVLLGESAVGKSSLVLRFVKNVFSTSQESTIGAAFLTQTLHVDGDSMKFEIWDTAGQERYHSLAPMYYRGANAAVIVYDITSLDSFERAKKWVMELDKQAQPDIVIALVGNKTDLQTQRQVSKEEVASYAQQNHPNLILMETSAKTGDNVVELFDSIAQKLPKTDAHLASMGRSFTTSGTRRIDLSSNGAQESKSGCC